MVQACCAQAERMKMLNIICGNLAKLTTMGRFSSHGAKRVRGAGSITKMIGVLTAPNIGARWGQSKPSSKASLWSLAAIFAAMMLVSGCSPNPKHPLLLGRTMGTTFSVRIAHFSLNLEQKRQILGEIQGVLDEINRQMSVWDENSEISRFNKAPNGEFIEISLDFQAVVRRALEIAAATGGAFDPTVGPLVNLWGFGPQNGPQRDKPTAEQLAAVRASIGWQNIEIIADGRLGKRIPGLQLDLGAIAKGYAVDRVANLLLERGFSDFLVEIGGETRAFGQNPEYQAWKIGILRPDGTQNIQKTVFLTNGRAIATSGDYRNFYRAESGEIETHIMDPRTGEPVRHKTASVSVLADDCMTADALATALFVLGPDEGLPLLAAKFPGVGALFILRGDDGSLREVASPNFFSR